MLDKHRIDRTAISFASLQDIGDERAYWRTRTPDERLEAAELIRQSVYGYDPSTARLQRVLEVVQCPWG